MFIRAYLRASTQEQDANRAKESIEAFASSKDVLVASYYIENESGTTVERPELDRMINDCKTGDIILCEKLDRLTRLPYEVWKTLQARIQAKGVTIVLLDQPMTHRALTGDEELNVMTKILTEFMINLAAAQARDDYETRLNRQKQGIAKAKAEGKYKGRKRNTEKRDRITELLNAKMSWAKIMTTVECSRSTVQSVAKELREVAE